MERITLKNLPPTRWRRLARANGGRHGNAILETALVLPLLLALAFGTVEFGYFFYVKHSLQGAAREGARQAILGGATQTDVEDAVADVMTASGFGDAVYNSVDIDPPTWASEDAGTPITVTVSANWGDIGVQPLGMISSDKLVVGSTVMRKEGASSASSSGGSSSGGGSSGGSSGGSGGGGGGGNNDDDDG